MNRGLQRLGVFVAMISSCIILRAEEINLVDNVNLVNQSLYLDVKIELPYNQVGDLFISPLQIKGELLSKFGVDRGSYVHQGIDIKVEEGTPVFAGGQGVITKAAPDSKGVDNGGGHMIFVDYGQGLEARYMHLSRYAVREGDVVEPGQVIGFTGSSGGVTTPHLHFEYRIDNQPLDPAFIFEANDIIGDNIDSFLVIQK